MSDSCKTAESKRWMDDTNMDKLKSLEKRKLENLPTYMHHIKRPHLKFRLHLKSRQQTHGRKEGSRRKKTANLVKLYEIFFQYPLAFR